MSCTMVNIYGKQLDEQKAGLYPGNFLIPAGDEKNPGLLVINESVHYLEQFGERPDVTIETNAKKVANSIVEDWVVARPEVIRGVAEPGLFYVEGALSKEEVLKKHATELALAVKKQIAWFKRLVERADEAWARHPGQHMAIMDDSKMACDRLGVSRPWNIDVTAFKNEICKYCMTPVHPAAIICSVCKQILKPELMPNVTDKSQAGK